MRFSQYTPQNVFEFQPVAKAWSDRSPDNTESGWVLMTEAAHAAYCFGKV